MDIGSVGHANFVDAAENGPDDTTQETASLPPRLQQLFRDARTDDVDEAMIIETLQEISQLPMAARPGALSEFANGLLPPVAGEDSFVDAAWDEVIASTRHALDNDPSLAGRADLHAQLDAAKWHCGGTHGHNDGGAWSVAFYGRLRTTPPEFWPQLLDAAVAGERILDWPDLESTVRNTDISFAGVSDRLATELSVALLEHSPFGDETKAVLQKRFGVTDRQFAQFIIPMAAQNLAILAGTRRTGFASLLDAHPFKDPAFSALVERNAAVERLEAFRATGPDWKSLTEDDPMATPERNAHWKAVLVDFFRQVEADGYASVWGSSESESDFVTADGSDALVATLTSMSLMMATPGNETQTLEMSLNAPLGFQPILLDRWARLVSTLPDKADAQALMPQVSAWREKVVLAFNERGEPANAVRAHVAEMRAERNLAGPGLGLPHLQRMVEAVFSSTPIEACGSLLSLLSELDGEGRGIVTDELLTDKMALFVASPNASAPYFSPHFAMKLMEVVGERSDTLPEGGDASKYTFEQLCIRFSVPSEVRYPALNLLLQGVSASVPLRSLDLRATIVDRLAKIGLHDEELVSRVLRNVREAIADAQSDATLPLA